MWLNTGNQAFNIYWSSTKQLVTFSIKDAPALSLFHIPQGCFIRNIPVDSNLFGRVFIEFYGSEDLMIGASVNQGVQL